MNGYSIVVLTEDKGVLIVRSLSEDEANVMFNRHCKMRNVIALFMYAPDDVAVRFSFLRA